MSPSTSTTDGPTPPTVAVSAPLKAGAFWAAVLLPFVALALVVSGLDAPIHYVALAGLVALNFVALVVGHDYGEAIGEDSTQSGSRDLH